VRDEYDLLHRQYGGQPHHQFLASVE